MAPRSAHLVDVGDGALSPLSQRQGRGLVVAAVLVFLGANLTGTLGAYGAGLITGHVGEVAHALSGGAEPGWVTWGSAIGLWAGFIGGALGAVHWLVPASVRTSLGLNASPIDLVGIPLGVAAQFVVSLLTAVLFANHDNKAPLQHWFGQMGPFSVRMLALCLILVVPVGEELVFRGLLGRGLVGLIGGRSFGPGVQIALVLGIDGLLFGLAHGEAVQLLGLALFGALQMFLYLRTSRLAMPMLCHAAFNAAALTSVLSRGHL